MIKQRERVNERGGERRVNWIGRLSICVGACLVLPRLCGLLFYRKRAIQSAGPELSLHAPSYRLHHDQTVYSYSKMVSDSLKFNVWQVETLLCLRTWRHTRSRITGIPSTRQLWFCLVSSKVNYIGVL